MKGRGVALALFATGFVLVFHAWLFSGFDLAFSDSEDGYLALALIEHWHHVFTGAAHWTDPFFFHPQPGTLGYTDAFFLFGLVHAPLRMLGLDAFTAYMLVMAALAAVGFFGFRWLAMRHFGVPPGVAAVGGFLFAFANVDAVKLIHVQAYAAMLLPGLCGLFLTGMNARRYGALAGAAAGLLYGLMFLTAFQTSWFFGVFLLLAGLVAPVALARTLWAKRAVVIAAGIGFAVGIVPFLVLYVPVFLAGHSRDFAEVAGNMPDWRDLANVTPDNAVWGPLLKWLTIVGRPDRPVWEVELGFTPIVLAAFAVGLGLLAVRRPARNDTVLLAFGLAVVALWLLQMDYVGWRPWHAVWAVVPGAKAIRYTFRSQLVANLFVTLIVARMLATVALATMARARAAAVLLGVALMVEQINLTWPATMSRREALAWIDAAPAAPPGCRAFYLLPGPSPRNGPQRQDDAMLFAELRGIPTVNGDSSWLPDGWALDEPASPGYATAVRGWAGRTGIAAQLCGLDPRSGRWTEGLP